MYSRNRLAALLQQHSADHTLPQAFYTDPEVYEFDLEAIFYRNWMMVGFASELDRPGAYIATSIGPSPIIVLRDRSNKIVGFHNSCRHRGAQICKSGTGKVTRLVCPYHQWTYTLDGKLVSARGETFDYAQYSLIPIRVEVVAGCIYVSLSEQAPDIGPFRAALEPALKLQNIENVKLAHVIELPEQANWKLVMENGRECHHCNVSHPEFMNAVPTELVESGKPFPEGEAATPFMKKMKELGFETEGQLAYWWQVGRIRLKDGFLSFSTDGGPLVKKKLSEANDGNLGTFRWATEPNNFCHVTSDSIFTFTANPTSPLTTTVTAKWYVHRDAKEGFDYDIDRLIYIWNETNLQDRDLAENNQRGVNSVGYRPGPYSVEGEPYIRRFIHWYSSEARQYLQKAAA